MKGNSEALFPDFSPVSTATWTEKIEEDLDDPRGVERLSWNAPGGLHLRSFYRREDLDDVPTGVPDAAPGWRLRQDLFGEDPETAHQHALEAIDGGATNLGFAASLTRSPDALQHLLADVPLDETGIHLAGPPRLLGDLVQQAQQQDISPDRLRGSLRFDPMALLARRGHFHVETAYDALADGCRRAHPASPGFRTVTADAIPYHEAGADPVMTLALALAAASEHLAQCTERGLSAAEVAASMHVLMPVGTSYFPALAAFRALRRLLHVLTEAYGASETRPFIQAVTARRPQTRYGVYMNLLRSTTGAAAALLGGADILAVRPFDGTLRLPDSFSHRMARNTQLILKHEAHLDRVADPAAGSYYIEVLTDKLSRKAWSRFQTLEDQGGLLEALKQDRIQHHLAAGRRKRTEALATRRRVRVGTNHYPDLEEEHLHDVEKHEPADDRFDIDSGEGANAVSVKPLPRNRPAEAFEALRLRTERHARRTGRRPAAFLLPHGPPSLRSERANFARSALGCAGFDIVENIGFETIDEGVEAAAASEAEVVVCCAPDEAYAELVQTLHEQRDAASGPLVVVAGPPEALPDDLRADGFVHRGMNLLETLHQLQDRLEITT